MSKKKKRKKQKKYHFNYQSNNYKVSHTEINNLALQVFGSLYYQQDHQNDDIINA